MTKSRMKSTRHRSVASALLLLCATSSAFALGFGRARTSAFMGQALEFSVPVRLEAGEDLTAECLGIEVYYGENRLSNAAVDHVVEPGPAANERLIRVRVEQPVDEPVVTLYVAAGCTGRVTRKFVAFADPPTSQVAENAAPRAVAPRPAAVAVPLVTAAPAAPAAASPASAPAPSREPVRRRATVAAAGASAATAPTETVAARPTPAPRVPRPPRATAERPLTPQLKLDLIDAEARTLPALKLALDPLASAPDDGQNTERRAAAAALWRALNASPEDLLRDQQRLTQLETQLARMQADSARTRELLESVEARLANSEAQRHDNPLTWGLAGLSALLAAAVGVLLWQRRREGASARWWAGAEPGIEPAPVADRPVEAPAAPAAVVVDAPAAVPPAAPAGFQTPTVPAELPAAPAPAPAPVVVAAPVAAPVPVSAAAPRQVSVEELIDLEQQAEFFVVLGQDEAAIDLLQTHLRSDANGSPLPYLKLLEIHRRRDEKDAYEQVRAQFNSQFNAWAPDWDQDLGRGRSLEDYPGVLERLILIWPSPAQALEVLQASLLRPDGVDANTFDLPAYRELLFLYAVVRDLVERGEVDTPGGIDLLLDDEPADARVDIPVAQVSEPVLPLVALEIEPSGSPLDVQRPPVDQGDAHVIDFEHIDLQPVSPKDKA